MAGRHRGPYFDVPLSCWPHILEEFEIAELLMKKYILSEGGGMEIYEEYQTMEVLDV